MPLITGFYSLFIIIMMTIHFYGKNVINRFQCENIK